MFNELQHSVERKEDSVKNHIRFSSEKFANKVEIHEIIAKIKNASSEERGEMWLELMKHNKSKEIFRTILISKGNHPIKMEALLAVQLMGESGIDIMREVFKKGDAWTRSQIVGIFAFLKNENTVCELIQAVEDTSIATEKRLLALNAIANLSGAHEERIIKLLDSKDPAVRARIARVVGQKRLEKGRHKLKRMLLEEKDLGVLYAVIEALNELGENITIEEVMNMREGNLRDKKSIVKKMKEIAKKYGNRMYSLVLALISIFISLGYTLASISSLLTLLLKDRGMKKSELKTEAKY